HPRRQGSGADRSRESRRRRRSSAARSEGDCADDRRSRTARGEDLEARAQRLGAIELRVRYARCARSGGALRVRRQAPAHVRVPGSSIAEEGRHMSDIHRVLVIGSGTMGAGIAEVCIKAGLDTTLSDVSQDIVDRGVARIESSLSKAVEKAKLSADAAKAA